VWLENWTLSNIRKATKNNQSYAVVGNSHKFFGFHSSKHPEIIKCSLSILMLIPSIHNQFSVGFRDKFLIMPNRSKYEAKVSKPNRYVETLGGWLQEGKITTKMACLHIVSLNIWHCSLRLLSSFIMCLSVYIMLYGPNNLSSAAVWRYSPFIRKGRFQKYWPQIAPIQ